jgi:hypothetical protein
MSTLLVVTVGQTDVQIVIDGVRRELRKERCAALHDEIAGREWSAVDAPERKDPGAVGTLPEGELLLCTPKLDAVLREVQPTAVLLLETRRNADSAPGDPRFAGAVLEKRLEEKGVRQVRRVAYLEGKERLEDRREPLDGLIRREVVRRLEDAIRASLAERELSRIVVAATGGFPEVSNLVEEIVRLHANGPVDAYEVSDGALQSPPTADRAVPRTPVFDPIVSFRARRRVLELVDKGNLLGAWAVAEPLHEHGTERAWTKVVDWLRCFASSLPMRDDCDISILKHPRMAVRAALRVECALRAGDIPRAVHGTVAFFEAALWDHIGEKTSRHASKRLFRFHVPPPKELVRQRDEDRSRPFIFKETADNSDWYSVDDSKICAIRIAKCYLKLDRLMRLGEALAADIRELRNDVAHNEPTSELMERARGRMQRAGLWSDKDTFLDQELVKDALDELGVGDSDRLLEDLLAEVRRRVVTPLTD